MYSLGISSQTPHKINYVGNFKKEDHKTFVTPTFSSVVYRVEVRLLVFVYNYLLTISIFQGYTTGLLSVVPPSCDWRVLQRASNNVSRYCRINNSR